jgi:AcrR family transcriptional regulator
MPLSAVRYRPSTHQRGEDTRRRILDTALALFAAEGFDSIGTRRIAEQAGVHLPAIQYYFGSKEGLYRAAIAHIGEQVAQTIAPITTRVRDCLASGTPTRAQLINLLCELVNAIVALFLDTTLPDRENRCLFIARVEVENEAALDPLHDIMREQLLTPAAALVGHLLNRPPEDDQVMLRALMIMGQAKLLGSRSVLRSLGWTTIDEDRLKAIQAMVNEHTRAICRALKAPA